MLTVDQAVPAHPASVRQLAAHFAGAAEQVREVRTELRGIASSVTTIPWEGLTALAFAGAVQTIPLDVDGLATGYDEVAVALQTLAGELEDRRSDARTQHQLGTQASDRLATLRPRRTSTAQALASARSRLSSAAAGAATASADTTPAAAANQASARAAVSDAAAAVEDVQRQLNDLGLQIYGAEGQLQRATTALEELQRLARDDARRAAERVREAKKEGESLLQRLGGAASSTVDVVRDVADVVVDEVRDTAGAVGEMARDAYDLAGDAVDAVRDAAVAAGQAVVDAAQALNQAAHDFFVENAVLLGDIADALGMAGAVIGMVPGLQGVGLALSGASVLINVGLAVYADGSWTTVGIGVLTMGAGVALSAASSAAGARALVAHNADLASRGLPTVTRLPSMFQSTSMGAAELNARLVRLKVDQAAYGLTTYQVVGGGRSVQERHTPVTSTTAGTGPVRRYQVPASVGGR